jgi:RNA polymerase sigma-70 factor (ECF subfamily)
MNAESTDARWKRLAALLEPVHDQALATARRLCRSSADGDDLYQESVLRAFEKLHTLRDESRFRSWFYATLLSRHRSRFRSAFWRRLVPWDEAFPDGREPVGEDGARRNEEAWRASRATQALGQLAAVQREAVVLFEIDGYSIEEIAVMQGVSISAVKSRLSRGRHRLRRIYERHGWLEDRGSVAGSPSGSQALKGPGSGSRGGRYVLLAAARAAGPSGEDRSHE